MKDDNPQRLRANRVWLTADSCDLEAFKGQVERSLNRADYPFASDVASNVLVYDGLEARKAAATRACSSVPPARFRIRCAPGSVEDGQAVKNAAASAAAFFLSASLPVAWTRAREMAGQPKSGASASARSRY